MSGAIVVMGVAGCGKSTVGALVADSVHAEFVDADSLHPPESVAKMAAGTPLTDDDRWPWLDLVGGRIADAVRAGRGIVVACSVLRRKHRDAIVRAAGVDVTFAHLHADAETLAARIAARSDHFMPASLLDSQLSTLEPLAEDEAGFSVDVVQAPSRVAAEITRRLAAG
jgi:carbohydrate kinase (thermoresistant glucokinase family)